jgi:predicted Fe-Mo cluster-binding NifX family protein
VEQAGGRVGAGEDPDEENDNYPGVLMKMRIVIPVADEKGEILSDHFGRAPYYAWFDVEDDEISGRGVVPNDSEHFGGTGLPPDRMMSLGAEAVITLGMGMRAINIFQNHQVAVLEAKNKRVNEVLTQFMEGELEELTEGCLHSHH